MNRMDANVVTLHALEEQLNQTIQWATAAKANLGTLLRGKRAEMLPVPVENLPPPAPPAPPPTPTPTKHRTKAEIVADALAAGVPEAALNNPRLLGPKGKKPSFAQLEATEGLIRRVRSANTGTEVQAICHPYL